MSERGHLESRIRDRFGQALAEKSTPELLSVVARTESLSRLKHAVWRKTASLSVVLETSIGGSRKSSGGGRPLPRHLAVEAARKEFEKQTQYLATGISQRSQRRMKTIVPIWLNRTVHLSSSANGVAEIAEDDSVRRLDIPASIELDSVTVGGGYGSFRVLSPLSSHGKNVTVAIIDGEISVDHPWLSDRAAATWNATREAWGQPNEHATAIAGLIGASASDYRGSAPECRMLNYKVWPVGPGENGERYLAEALARSLEDGAEIVNCSIGLNGTTEAAQRMAVAFETVVSEGVVIVKSAGNKGPSRATVTEPSGAIGVMIVGACASDGTRLTQYSGRGPGSTGINLPTVLAPGGEEFQPLPCIGVNRQQIQYLNGTSLAAGLVSGLAACAIGSGSSNPADVAATISRVASSVAGEIPEDQGFGAVLVPINLSA